MPKQKTNKSIIKRIKITSKGKLLRRHQLSGGHLKRKKSKNALNRSKRTFQVASGEGNKYKRLIGA